MKVLNCNCKQCDVPIEIVKYLFNSIHQAKSHFLVVETKHQVSDNAKSGLKLDNGTVSQKLALRSWGPLNIVDKADVGIMSVLKIRIETEEYIYEEYIEA